ncbi:MAG: hypothetical protein SNJ54_09110 [Anaerolineae bacterium]
MKKFNVLKFIIRMLKVGAWLAVVFTFLIAAVAGWGVLESWARFPSAVTFSAILNQVLAFSLGISFGLVTALLIYGLAELLDLLIGIQENTYSAANVLRNMYRDQLNAHHDPTMRLRDVTPDGDVIEAELPRSNGSTRG